MVDSLDWLRFMEHSLTFLLNLAQQGDRKAENQAIPAVYERLCAVARGLLRTERRGHTMQINDLVSEAFLDKLRRISAPILSREHYYSLAARAMRQILIEHARRTQASRRRISSEVIADLLLRIDCHSPIAEDRIAVKQVLQALAKIDGRATQAITYRFIEQLTIEETAQRLDCPEWKIRADCDFGLKWMAKRLGDAR